MIRKREDRVLQRANSLVLCPESPSREVMERVGSEYGSAYRLAFHGLLTALVRESRLSPLVREHLGLAHGGNKLKRIDVYAQPRPMVPMHLNSGIVLRTSDELARYACEYLARQYEVEAGYHQVSRASESATLTKKAFFGCMDDRFFYRMLQMIQEQGDGNEHYYSWAGVVTCPHAHEFGVTSRQTDLLVRQLRTRSLSEVREVYLVVHEDCAGHGGKVRLGEVGPQIDYFRERLTADRAKLQNARPRSEFKIHFAHDGGGIERIALWKPLS